MWNLFRKKTLTLEERTKAFWQWFEKNEETLCLFASEPHRVCKLVSKELAKVKPLAFEFGPGTNGKSDFIISADGIRKDFPSVAALCKAAPELQKWNIIAFRQHQQIQGTILTHGISVDIDDCAFAAEKTEEGLIDLVLYMKGLTPQTFEAYGTAGFLLLDTMLGEFDVATKLGGIDFEPLSDLTLQEKQLTPLTQLSTRLEELQTPTSKFSIEGAWQGNYKYDLPEGQADSNEFPFRAQIKITNDYLEGTMEDNSNLGQARLFGLCKDSIVIFEKTYDTTNKDPVIYQGRIAADGQSLSGKWDIESKRTATGGLWSMQRE